MISMQVVEPSQVGQARRRATEIGRGAGLAGEALDRLALIVTEMATNLVRHAVNGELLLGRTGPEQATGCCAIGLDGGPGVPSVEQALEDGFTTATSDRGIGGGLGAIRRMSDAFDIHSDGDGTTVVAEVAPGRAAPAAPFAGGLAVAKPGTEAGGDAWAIRRGRDFTLVGLFDVLGHGPAAADVAQRAVAAFDAAPDGRLEEAEAALSAALAGSRGAAMMLAEIPHSSGPLRALGIGNIRGEVLLGDQRRGIVSAAGIAGQLSRSKRVLEYEWAPGAALLLNTDGLKDRPGAPLPAGLLFRDPLTVAATVYRRRKRGTDDSGVVVVKAA